MRDYLLGLRIKSGRFVGREKDKFENLIYKKYLITVKSALLTENKNTRQQKKIETC